MGRRHNRRNRNIGNGLNIFFSKIYLWMFIGLLISGISSYLTMNSKLGIYIFENSAIFYGITGINIGILLLVQYMISRFPLRLSFLLYFTYVITEGILLSWIFLFFELSIILIVFFVSALLYLMLALYGFFTKDNVTNWGSFLFIGMWGVFFASLLNMFLQNTMFDIIVSSIAVLVFCGLTIYDHQFYKEIYYDSSHYNRKRYVLLGALHMYINFIMIFINLLKLSNYFNIFEDGG
jgi:hypothetical protein